MGASWQANSEETALGPDPASLFAIRSLSDLVNHSINS
jgi:hypothetical protein